MKILIDGAGIAGLAVALHLKKYNHEITIIEKSKDHKQEGYVLGVWSELTYLDQYGFREKLSKVGFPSHEIFIRGSDGNLIRSVDLSRLNTSYGQVYIVTRDDLHKILRDTLNEIPIQLGTTISSIDEKKDGVKVVFDNGRQDTFDLVIGTDGVHSQVRKFLFKDFSLKYFGLQFWMYMSPPVSDMPSDTTMIADNGRFFGAYPNGKDYLFTIFALPAPKERMFRPENSVQKLREEFKSFGWITPEVLASMKDTEDLFYDSTYEVDLPKWHTDRVVLLGDSAHALVATASMGASMAFEDAFVLSRELAKISDGNYKEAFIKYQQRKEERLRHIRRASHFYGYLISLSNRWSRTVRNSYLKVVPGSLFLKDIAYVLANRA